MFERRLMTLNELRVRLLLSIDSALNSWLVSRDEKTVLAASRKVVANKDDVVELILAEMPVDSGETSC